MFVLNDQRLEDQLDPSLLERADRYLSGLSPAARGLITEHKLGAAIGEMNFPLCRRLLESCVELGIMQKRYAVTCPACSYILYLQTSQNIHEREEDGAEVYCNYCNQTHPRNLLTEQDMRTIFSLEKDI